MTFKYNNVYVDDTVTIAGPYEKKGPLSKYFDKTIDDLYNKEKSFEKAEIKMVKDNIKLMQKKTNINNPDLVIGGDLMNQITATIYGTKDYGKSFIGIYGACSNSVLGMIIGSNFIESRQINNCLNITSSHNMTSERQFRNPTEYGSPRKKTETFTSTGSASIMLTNKKTNVRIESSTIGKITDYNQTDVKDMGRVMAPAAINTLRNHLKEMNRNPEYYDLILTGDLGLYGKEILIKYMKEKYNYNLKSNYNDCGVMLYDLKKQKYVNAGGSGPVCSALVNFGYIYDLLINKKIKKVLLIATGALFSPISVFQKEKIYSIAHAISLEAI